LRGRPNGAVLIDNGKISKIGDYDDLRRLHPNSIRWLDRRPAAIFPGLIDCHTHLPQYSVVARGESELLPWLRQHIFPVEREFTGPKARAEAPAFFQELVRNGTTTVMAYAAIYEDSCDAGFEAAKQSGMRAILGEMMMDLGSYGQLQPKKVLSISLLESERLCRKWHRSEEGRLEYAFSPRFAVTCSEKMMRGAAELAARFEAYLEAHPGKPLYLTEICAAVGAPERTLRIACAEHLGMGPIRYLALRRMHLVRRALLRGDPSTTVTRVATDHGFWELGRFAVAYRTIFGETPSASLHRPPDDERSFPNRSSSFADADLRVVRRNGLRKDRAAALA